MIRDYAIGFAMVLALSVNGWGCGSQSIDADPGDGYSEAEDGGQTYDTLDGEEPWLLIPGLGKVYESDLPPEMTQPEASESGDIGTSRQGLFMPSGYGAECSGDGARCSPPWQASTCCVPDSRKIGYYFGEATCPSTDNIRSTIKNALVKASDILVSLGWESSVLVDSTLTSALPGHWVRCAAIPGQALGALDIDALTSDDHTTQYGTLEQFKSPKIRIDIADIIDNPVWINGTALQRKNYLNNITIHEAFHAAGLGHVPITTAATGQTLMEYGCYGNVFNDCQNKSLSPTTTERSMIDCYNETSGTNPNC